MSSRLIELTYFDPKSSVRLTAYADTVMVDRDGKDSVITAIRFGGYPEMVRAMADAIYGGATIETDQNGKKRSLVAHKSTQVLHPLGLIQRQQGNGVGDLFPGHSVICCL